MFLPHLFGPGWTRYHRPMQSDTQFAILLDGDLDANSSLANLVAGHRVIAADGGIRHAKSLGVTPEIWVGDFDSSDHNLANANGNVPRHHHPAEKAVSDGELAIEEAIKRGARSLLLIGALGGDRADHVQFHLTKAQALAKAGFNVLLTDGRQVATPMGGPTQKTPFDADGIVFSIVGTSELDGLTITNAKWPLDAVHVPFGSTLTLSNVGTRHTRIVLDRGDALLFTQLKR